MFYFCILWPLKCYFSFSDALWNISKGEKLDQRSVTGQQKGTQDSINVSVGMVCNKCSGLQLKSALSITWNTC